MSDPFDIGIWFDQHALPLVGIYFAQGRTGLTDVQYVPYLLWTLNGEVGNGGAEQYFFNAGHLARDTAGALEAIGAHRLASSFSHLCSFFPGGFPSAFIDTARRDYDHLPAAFFEACGRFDTLLLGTAENDYQLEENLVELLHKHVSEQA